MAALFLIMALVVLGVILRITKWAEKPNTSRELFVLIILMGIATVAWIGVFIPGMLHDNRSDVYASLITPASE